ncbi:MAG: macro domain-containing protein [Alphaproteobacteria bacterium]|nr:macro domain-containing protein [Alphaproteobacteria bacterium]
MLIVGGQGIGRGNSMKAITADITTLAVDAVVNAANNTLRGGGGVDGAIHRGAGRGLLTECLTLGGCDVGMAKITSGHLLPALHIIHTVGPIWRGGNHGEAELLASCYRFSLALAVENNITSIAFPAISTGAFGYPLTDAAIIAVETTCAFLKEHAHPLDVIFCCFDTSVTNIYQNTISVVGTKSCE